MAKEKAVKEDTKYPKTEFLRAEKYLNNRDILEVVLSETETYTVEEVENKIQEFNEREVR